MSSYFAPITTEMAVAMDRTNPTVDVAALSRARDSEYEHLG